MRKFILLLLPLGLSVSCSLKPKHQKVLAGAVIGSALTAATAESQANKSLYVSSGAAVGALAAWTLVTLTDQENIQMQQLETEDLLIKKKLELIEKVRQKNSGLQKRSVQEWKEVSRQKNQKKLQFIEAEYQEVNE